MLFWYGGAAIFGLQFVVSVFGILSGGSTATVMFPGVLTAFFGFMIYRKRQQSGMSKAMAQQQQIDLQEHTKAIASGQLPISPSGVRLYANEVVHYSANSELLESKTVGYKANTAGLSVRVAKGVTLRSGGIKGGVVKDLVPVAKGEFAVTSGRLVFAGDLKSFDVTLSKINHIEKLVDGLIIHSDGKSRILNIPSKLSNVALCHLIIDKLLADNPMK